MRNRNPKPLMQNHPNPCKFNYFNPVKNPSNLRACALFTGDQVEQKIREVRRSKRPVDGASVSLQTGPAHRREVVIVCVAKAPDRNSRDELLQGHIDQAISESGTTDYLLVVMNAAAKDGSPYHLIAFSKSELTL